MSDLLTIEKAKKIFSTKEDLANTKAEMIKWMFIFWIGQIAVNIVLYFLKP